MERRYEYEIVRAESATAKLSDMWEDRIKPYIEDGWRVHEVLRVDGTDHGVLLERPATDDGGG